MFRGNYPQKSIFPEHAKSKRQSRYKGTCPYPATNLTASTTSVYSSGGVSQDTNPWLRYCVRVCACVCVCPIQVRMGYMCYILFLTFYAKKCLYKWKTASGTSALFWDLWLCGLISAPAIRFWNQKTYARWSMVLRVGGCTLFGVRTILSTASGCPFVKTQKVASKFLHKRFTQD